MAYVQLTRDEILDAIINLILDNLWTMDAAPPPKPPRRKRHWYPEIDTIEVGQSFTLVDPGADRLLSTLVRNKIRRHKKYMVRSTKTNGVLVSATAWRIA